MRRTLCTAILVAAVATSTVSAGHDLTRKDKRVLRNATEVLDVLTSAPDRGISRDLLSRAECVMVFPNVTKGAFFVGGRYGRGVAVCRDGAGEFGAPAFFSIGGPSIGWQWGGSQTDFVLLVMNENGMKNLLQDNFTIGGQASAVVGPVGRSAEAATDVQLNAQILSWSRSQGLFVGAALEGAVVQPSEDANQRLYGKPVEAKAILGKGRVPAAAREFVALVDRVAPAEAERGG